MEKKLALNVIAHYVWGMTNTMTKRGEVGKHVWWTTSDMACSYEPCIHFGDFTLIIGRGKSWGAHADSGALVTLSVLALTQDEEQTEDIEMGSMQAEMFLSVPSVRAACAYLVAQNLDKILAEVGTEALIQDIVVAADQLIAALNQ